MSDRPKAPPKNARLVIHMSSELLAAIRQAAGADEVSTEPWARMLLVSACRKRGLWADARCQAEPRTEK